MIIQRGSEPEIRADQVRAMARGLYHLANIDGITDKEKDQIKAFLAEGKLDLDLDTLAKIPFSIEELLFSLETVFLRKTFLKVCILLARADGAISAEETDLLRRMAQAMSINEPLDSVMAELEGRTL